MEINGDVTDAGRTNDDERTREDRATQPMDAGWLSFAIAVEGTHPCTSLGLMLLITGTVARPFMTQRSASTILEIPIFGQRQTQKAYMQYYLNMKASASNNL